MRKNEELPHARWTVKVKLESIDRKLMTTLNRVVDTFMDKSWAKSMEKTDVDSALNIAKFIKNLMKEQQETAAKIGDEELERVANQNEPK